VYPDLPADLDPQAIPAERSLRTSCRSGKRMDGHRPIPADLRGERLTHDPTASVQRVDVQRLMSCSAQFDTNVRWSLTSRSGKNASPEQVKWEIVQKQLDRSSTGQCRASRVRDSQETGSEHRENTSKAPTFHSKEYRDAHGLLTGLCSDLLIAGHSTRSLLVSRSIRSIRPHSVTRRAICDLDYVSQLQSDDTS
jgi:hypothetical protein